MSEELRELTDEKPYYCHWHDGTTNFIVHEYKNGRLAWSGCPDCYVKMKEIEKKLTTNLATEIEKELENNVAVEK